MREKAITTTLELTEQEEKLMQKIKREMMQNDLEELPSIEENEVRIDIVYLYEVENNVEIRAFIRNSTHSDIIIKECNLELYSLKENKVIGTKMIDFSDEFEKISRKKARAIDIMFNDIHGEITEREDYIIRWNNELKSGEIVEVDYKFVENLGNEKEIVKEFISNLKPVMKNSVTIDLFSISSRIQSEINIIFLVRNTYDNPIGVKKLPIKIYQKGELVAGGVFETEFINVDKNEGKMFNFPLKEEFILNNNINFQQCEVKFK